MQSNKKGIDKLPREDALVVPYPSRWFCRATSLFLARSFTESSPPSSHFTGEETEGSCKYDLA